VFFASISTFEMKNFVQILQEISQIRPNFAYVGVNASFETLKIPVLTTIYYRPMPIHLR